MSAGHTQGAWEWDGVVCVKSQGELVALVYSTDGNLAANACLIAAAPELLHALCTALPYVEDALKDPCFKPEAVRKTIALIHAAIKSAELP